MSKSLTKDIRKKSGRPKGSHEDETKIGIQMRKHLTKRVKKELNNLIDSQLQLAKGIKLAANITLIDRKDGKKVTGDIFTKAPEGKAGEYLMNQAIGKPKESVEMSGEVKTIIDTINELNKE